MQRQNINSKNYVHNKYATHCQKCAKNVENPENHNIGWIYLVWTDKYQNFECSHQNLAQTHICDIKKLWHCGSRSNGGQTQFLHQQVWCQNYFK